MTSSEKAFVLDIHNKLNRGDSVEDIVNIVSQSKHPDKKYILALLEGVQRYGLSVGEVCTLLRRLLVCAG